MRAAYRTLVESDAGAKLQGFAVLVRTADGDFVGIAPVGRDDGAVGSFADADGFGVFKHQLGFVEAAVARPSHIAEQVGFVGGAVHT